MEIGFQRKIAGRTNRLSISIPAKLAKTYNIDCGQYITVWFQDTDFGPKFQSKKFSSRVSKCGLEGRLIYIPKQFVEDYKLTQGQEFYWKVEVL